jgi:phenylalanyl-tRNA synthetase beta chain
MKISYSWLSSYVDVSNWSVERVAEMLTEIGLEVEGVEKVEQIPGGLAGVIVGEVTACEEHPNADRLKLTKVNVGDELLSIVCGAPNVAAGQKVAVAPVGTKLHFNDGKTLKIKKGKIRGEVSEGMICAEDELGISDKHDGILVLDDSAIAGEPLRNYYDVSMDHLIDIDLTPNRADAVCHLGVAEDLAAYINTNEKNKVEVVRPPAPSIPACSGPLEFQLEVRAEALCPRYAGVVMQNIKVRPSSEKLRSRLKSIGLRPVNNVVDITQFVMHEMGQPLHAFDCDQIGGRKIVVDTLPEGTIFKALDDTEVELTGEEVMICDGEGRPLCMGGVFGGAESGVRDQTTSLFLESAYFDSRAIRKASMGHQLRTDAAKIYEKGADPNRVQLALARAVQLILEEAGGEVASEVFDTRPKGLPRAEVVLTFEKLNSYLGVQMKPEQVREICEQLQMGIVEEQNAFLRLRIPSNKPDVLREVDVIEEIIRIYGLGNIPVAEKAHMPLIASDFPGIYDYRNKVSYLLNGLGMHEAMSLSLVDSGIYTEFGGDEDIILVNNSSNRNLNAMRKEMYSSLLQNMERNMNRQEKNISLYEFGRVYSRDADGAHREEERLNLGISGHRQQVSRFNNNPEPVDFFDIKALASRVMDGLGLTGYQESELVDHDYLSYGLRWHRGTQVLAEMGKVKKGFSGVKVDADVYAADIRWSQCVHTVRGKTFEFQALDKYPFVERDLALIVNKGVTFEEIERAIYKVEKKWIRDIILFDHYTNEEQLGAGKKSYAIRMVLQSRKQTLKDKQVDKVIEEIVESLSAKVGARLR